MPARLAVTAFAALAPPAAFALVVFSLTIDRPLRGDRERAWAEYGLPFTFVRAEEQTALPPERGIGDRAVFNPWEKTTTVDRGRFASSWAVTLAALWLGIALVWVRFGRVRRT